MAESGHIWGRRSPHTCRNRGDLRRPGCTRLFPQGTAEDDDWETDPDYMNNGPGQGFQWAQREISTASLISDLSKSIRECSLRKSSPDRKKDFTDDCQSRCQDSARNPGKAPEEGHRPRLCSQVPSSSPSLGIERSSVFNRDAAQTLDTFFSEKLRTWASDAAQLSDCYENVESLLLEEPSSRSKSRRRAEQEEHAGTGPISRRQDHSRGAQARGQVVQHSCASRDHSEESGTYHPQCLRRTLQHPLTGGRGEGLGALPRREGGSRLSTPETSSARRILPQCQITHIQSCRACQAFNQGLPAGQEALEENCCCWVPGQEEAREQQGVSSSRRKRRTGGGGGGPSSPRQLPEQLSKVQQWLEQTPVEQPAGQPWPQRQEGTHRPRDPAEGVSWDRGGSPEPPAEVRRRRKSHRGEAANHQPVARILACDDTAPATCSCLFCERQRRHARKPAAGKKGPNPSAEEVAVQLQAENRVPRIVEAFERRSLREAKRAEWERACQSARQREPEKRAKTTKNHGGDARRGPPQSSSTKARKSHAKEDRREDSRPSTTPEDHQKHSRRKEGEVAAGKRPSFIGRLRGLY